MGLELNSDQTADLTVAEFSLGAEVLASPAILIPADLGHQDA